MENDVFVLFLLLLASACGVTRGQGKAGDVIGLDVFCLHVLRAWIMDVVIHDWLLLDAYACMLVSTRTTGSETP